MQVETIGIIENFEDTEYLDVMVACSLTILTTIKRRRRKRRNRVIWVRSWVRNRMQFGAYNNLLVQLRNTDPISFQNFFRMDIATFEEVLALISTLIERRDTNYREAIPAGERLAVTLRFLATGN